METDPIKEQFNKLPQALQNALNAVQWKKLLKEIANNNKLSPEQAANLETETMFILYGFQNPEYYIQNLVSEVGLNEEMSIKIGEEVNEKISKIIEKQLEENHTQTTHQNHFIPEVTPPSNLPVIEEGEKVHNVPHVEQLAPATAIQTPPQPLKQRSPTFNPPQHNRYPGSKDPYREPLV